MTPLDLLREAESLGLTLIPRGDKLRVVPGDRCPPEFAEVLRQHKPAILRWLSNPPCPGWGKVPPANLPLELVPPAMNTADARRIMDYVMRQIGDKTCPLCEWCVRRETRYWESLRWPDQTCALAVARDVARWQLGRDEKAMIGLIASFDAVQSNR
ncbi:MAG: hypothetical protein AB9869_09965 [Verrucomicrobiia bacterium]